MGASGDWLKSVLQVAHAKELCPHFLYSVLSTFLYIFLIYAANHQFHLQFDSPNVPTDGDDFISSVWTLWGQEFSCVRILKLAFLCLRDMNIIAEGQLATTTSKQAHDCSLMSESAICFQESALRWRN